MLLIRIMTHTYRTHYYHLIWSTKNREKWITPEIQNNLYLYIGGIMRNNHNCVLLGIGGISDHVHLLMSLSLPDKFTQVVRDVKANSSLWIHKNYPQSNLFAWQEGYASYSVSYSSVEKVLNYINNQEEHHKKTTFDEEYVLLLRKCQIEYDEEYVLG